VESAIPRITSPSNAHPYSGLDCVTVDVGTVVVSLAGVGVGTVDVSLAGGDEVSCWGDDIGLLQLRRKPAVSVSAARTAMDFLIAFSLYLILGNCAVCPRAGIEARPVLGSTIYDERTARKTRAANDLIYILYQPY
jgi:hypothetical protein